MRIKFVIVVIAGPLSGIAAAQPFVILAATERTQSAVSIFVGPQTRGSFVDVDQGVLDSIRDIQNEVKKRRKELRLATKEDDATLVLVVVSRGVGGNGGTVGAPVGALTVFVPLEKHAVQTVLRVRDFEKPIDVQGDTWRECAGAVVNDVRSWVKANRERLP